MSDIMIVERLAMLPLENHMLESIAAVRSSIYGYRTAIPMQSIALSMVLCCADHGVLDARTILAARDALDAGQSAIAYGDAVS